MHQIGFIEDIAIQLAIIGILHQNLRGLAQTGQQLMRRLRREDHRLFTARTIGTNGVIVAIEIMERRMRQPGFIKVQRINLAVEHLFDFFDVVQNAVVGRLRNRQHTWLGILVGNEWIGRNFLLDAFPGKFALRNRADDAEVVAGRHQKDGNRATHDDGVQHRLMTVAVNHHNVARCHGRVPDDLVRRRRAVRHKIQVVTIEDACGVAFRRCHRAGMIQQLTELFHGITHIGTQHVFTKELVEHLTDRALQKGNATRVSGAMPRIRTISSVMRQRSEERWWQRIQISLRLTHHIAGDKFRRVFVHVNEAM